MVVEQTAEEANAPTEYLLPPAQGPHHICWVKRSTIIRARPWSVAQLLFLECEDTDADISLYINSPGGSVTAGMAIYDTMQYRQARPVATICASGMAASMGAFLLSSGAKGKRFALPNAEIMIHQPLGGMQGQAEDMKIHASRIIKVRDRLNRILAVKYRSASVCDRKGHGPR